MWLPHPWKVFEACLEGVKTAHLNTTNSFLPTRMPHTNYVVKQFPETSRTGPLQSKKTMMIFFFKAMLFMDEDIDL